MSGRKVFNDPVYGLITFPYDILYELIDHRYFQRLRRISQLGLTNFVYPGANHSRFHHALGALHLMTRALDVLKQKEVEITEEESEAACIAILLHDIGHGPFSHALENTILDVHHEQLSLDIMEMLNREFHGKLTLAIDIFQGNYKKRFLGQLISGQVDMDRMDYLSRDSFYTGVAEGVIGHNRIISMLNVADDQLVIEEKGLYSIEKFLMARNIMYWQVYLHKTVLSAEQMLIKLLQLINDQNDKEELKEISSGLKFFLTTSDEQISKISKEKIVEKFCELDDYDVWYTLKKMLYSDNRTFNFLSKSIIERKLFRIHLEKKPFSRDFIRNVRRNISAHFKVSEDIADSLIIHGKESNQAYSTAHNEIQILKKTGQIIPFSELTENLINTSVLDKYFLCYPRF